MDWITWLSVVGSIASLIGLPLAIVSAVQAWRAATAAAQAKDEVEKFRREIKLISDVLDFQRAIALMDDVKSFIRHANFPPVPDRIATLIVLLNNIRATSSGRNQEAETTIQKSVVTLRRIEDAITRSLLAGEDKPRGISNFNQKISSQIDLLHPLLVELRDKIGARND